MFQDILLGLESVFLVWAAVSGLLLSLAGLVCVARRGLNVDPSSAAANTAAWVAVAVLHYLRTH